MLDSVFKKLKSKLYLETGNDLDQVSFKAEYANYTLSFYGNKEDNYNLIIYECGFGAHKTWRNIELSKNQKKELKNILDSKIDSIEKDNYDDDIANQNAMDWKEHGIYSYGY